MPLFRQRRKPANGKSPWQDPLHWAIQIQRRGRLEIRLLPCRAGAVQTPTPDNGGGEKKSDSDTGRFREKTLEDFIVACLLGRRTVNAKDSEGHDPVAEGDSNRDDKDRCTSLRGTPNLRSGYLFAQAVRGSGSHQCLQVLERNQRGSNKAQTSEIYFVIHNKNVSRFTLFQLLSAAAIPGYGRLPRWRSAVAKPVLLAKRPS